MKIKLLRYLLIAAISSCAWLLTGCNNNDDTDEQSEAIAGRATIESYQLQDEVSVDQLPNFRVQDLGFGTDNAMPGAAQGAWDFIHNTLKKYVTYVWVDSYSIDYHTITLRNGRWVKQIVSGRFLVPRALNPFDNYSIPVVALQHPTQTERSQSPSIVAWNGDNELTVPFAYLLAYMGYAVIVPDYPGLGKNTDPHPYCIHTISNSVEDAIKTVTSSVGIKDFWPTFPTKVKWDGRIFMMGYSEGGYATMVTARVLQDQKITVAGVAVLDAPLSLSDTMRNVMLRKDVPPDEINETPYFMPYVIAGYEDFYKNSDPAVHDFDFETVIKTAVPGYNGNFAKDLYKMLNGDYNGGQISAFMKKATPYEGPQSVLTESFLKKLQQTEISQNPYKALVQNDAYYGWKPAMPMMLAHNINDDAVPVGNTDNAVKAFSGLSNVQVQKFKDALPELGTIHAGALPYAYIRGIEWIDAIAYPERHK